MTRMTDGSESFNQRRNSRQSMNMVDSLFYSTVAAQTGGGERPREIRETRRRRNEVQG